MRDSASASVGTPARSRLVARNPCSDRSRVCVHEPRQQAATATINLRRACITLAQRLVTRRHDLALFVEGEHGEGANAVCSGSVSADIVHDRRRRASGGKQDDQRRNDGGDERVSQHIRHCVRMIDWIAGHCTGLVVKALSFSDGCRRDLRLLLDGTVDEAATPFASVFATCAAYSRRAPSSACRTTCGRRVYWRPTCATCP